MDVQPIEPSPLATPGRRKRRRMWYIVGGVLCVLLVLPVAGLAVLSLTSRRPDNLGLQDGKLRPCPDSPNCVCSEDNAPGHAIAALPWNGPAAAGLDRMADLLQQLPRTKVVTRKADYLHAEATSALFRFVDDVEVRVDEAAGLIQIRSASRAGRSDLGVNRRRVEELRRLWSVHVD